MKTRTLSDNELMRECLREALSSLLEGIRAKEEFDSDKVTRFLSAIIPLLKTISPDPNEERLKSIESSIKDLMSLKSLMIAKGQLKAFQGAGTISIGSA